MEETERSSRHLPAFVRDGLERIAMKPFCGDGRSTQWVRKLGSTEFASIEIKDELTPKGRKKKTIVKASITERGRYALERDRRGVDPYLVMTA